MYVNNINKILIYRWLMLLFSVLFTIGSYSQNSQNDEIGYIKMEYLGYSDKIIPPIVLYVNGSFDTTTLDVIFFFEITSCDFGKLKKMLFEEKKLIRKHSEPYFSFDIIQSTSSSYFFASNKQLVELIFNMISFQLRLYKSKDLIKEAMINIISQIR